MQLRIFAGMQSNIERMRDYKKKTTEELGFAKVNLEAAKVKIPGIVNEDLVNRILSTKKLPISSKTSLEKARKTFTVLDNKWLSFYYLDKKEGTRMNLFGALYHAGLFPQEDREPIEHVLLSTAGLHTRKGVLCVLSHAGRTSEEDYKDLTDQVSSSIGANKICKIVEMEDEDLIELAKMCIEEGNTVTTSSIDTAEGKTTLRHPTDIFQDPDIQQVDDILKIRKKIHSGKWNRLTFLIKEPAYFLKISKARSMKKKMTLYDPKLTKVMDKEYATIIFNDLIDRLSKIKKLRVYQKTL